MIENEPPIEIVKTSNRKIFGIIALVVLIGFMILLAMPNHSECRKVANEPAAKALLQRIIDAQASYSTRNGIYADNLSRLVDSKFLQEDAFTAITQDGETATVQGYIYKQTNWTQTKWKVTAKPIDKNIGTKRFSVDQNGDIIEY